MYSQILIIIGLLLNLLGASKLYKSVVPFPYHQYAVSGKDKESLPVATLDMDIAKKGFKYIFIGIMLQIIAMAIFDDYGIIYLYFKALYLNLCK